MHPLFQTQKYCAGSAELLGTHTELLQRAAGVTSLALVECQQVCCTKPASGFFEVVATLPPIIVGG